MRIDTIISDGVAFMTVAGEIDLAVAYELRAMGEMALSPFVGTLRIGLAGVTFLDSTAISALVAIRNKADETHHVVILENPSPRVRRILKLTGLDETFTIEPAGDATRLIS